MLLPFHSQDLICNSLYCLPYNSDLCQFGEFGLDQLIILKLILFFILITCLLDIVMIMQGEILFWSLMEVKGLRPSQ